MIIFIAMRGFVFVFILFSTYYSHALVHGSDDRIDIFENKNPMLTKLAKSTAAMIRKYYLRKKDDSYLLTSRPSEFYLPKPICSTANIKFKRQMASAECSGFLIAPDIIVTAGHCVDSDFSSAQEKCQNYYWVFDYAATADNLDLTYSIEYDPEYDYTEEFITKNIKKHNVYECKKVLNFAYTKDEKDPNKYLDYAIIKLTRKVEDRSWLKIRKDGEINYSDPVVAIGHPLGLPTKIAGNSWITNDSYTNTFMANIDAMENNSGSAVFNGQTGLVEGIIVRGSKDYIRRNGCNEPFVIDEYDGYIMIFKITQIPMLNEYIVK